jgi:glycerophosphoryl diester phosphodiesterase
MKNTKYSNRPVTRYFKLTIFLFLLACSNPSSTASLDKILEHFRDAKGNYVMVAAHRAAHNGYPENSLSAIRHAIEIGADIVEIDVRTTKDGISVLMHDSSVDRTTNGTGKIKDFTLAELKALKLKMRDGTVTEEQIPTFEEALKLIYYGNIMADLDLKTDMLKPLVDDVKRTNTSKQVVYFDNDYHALLEIREMDSSSMFMPRAYSYEMADSAIKIFQPQVIHIDPSFYTVDVTELIRSNNARVWINALGETDEMILKGDVEKAMDDLLRYKANIIQTDEPELILKYLISKGLHD